MKYVEVEGAVTVGGELHAPAPAGLPPGPVKLLALIPGEDDEWMRTVAAEWAADLADPAQDVYSLSDGEPVKP